jgi:ankyrin repeat protein
MSLFDAAAKNDYDLVKKIIDEKKVDINDTDEDGETPLLIASRKGHLQVCKLLINNGSNVNDVNEQGETPLHLALRHLPVCKLLIRNGADINHKNIDEETPLLIASYLGNLLACKLFIRNNADVNSVDKYKQTSLHWASIKGHLSICELLISNGADVNYEDEYGGIPLHKASENNHVKVCKLLIRSGSNINHNDNDDKTPIDLAIDYKIIKVLIENGADKNIDITDKKVQEDLFYKKAPEKLVKKNLEDYVFGSLSSADKSSADNSSTDKSSTDEKSPRTAYDKLIHSRQITMLGGEVGSLFKIRIDHPDIFELFENYENLSEKLSENPRIDCAFQVLFSLGLREVNISKRNSAVINKLSKYNKAVGVNLDDLNEYLEQIFDLEKKSLMATEYKRFNCNYFNVNLSDGQSTIILLRFDKSLHYVVVFKSGWMLFIFDPQQPIIFECQEIEEYYPNVIGFFVIELNATIEDKPLRVEKCSLPIFALGNKKMTSKKSKKMKKKSSKKRKVQKET